MPIERRKPLTAKVGVFGVGMDVYWAQFPGLLEELLGYLDVFEQQVRASSVDVVNFGMIDNAQAAYAALKKMKAANLDLVFCDMLTYATSATFGILIRELDVPIVLVALQPRSRIDYENATIYMQLCNDNICSLPEFAGVAVRMGKRVPESIIGVLEGDASAQREPQRRPLDQRRPARHRIRCPHQRHGRCHSQRSQRRCRSRHAELCTQASVG